MGDVVDGVDVSCLDFWQVMRGQSSSRWQGEPPPLDLNAPLLWLNQPASRKTSPCRSSRAIVVAHGKCGMKANDDQDGEPIAHCWWLKAEG